VARAPRPVHGRDRPLVVARSGAGPDARGAGADRLAARGDAGRGGRRARRRRVRAGARAGAAGGDPTDAATGVGGAGRRGSVRDAAALAAGLVTVTVWGSAFVAIRDAGRALSPGSVALGRLVVSLAILGAAAALRRERLPGRADLARIAAFGVLWLGVYS